MRRKERRKERKKEKFSICILEKNVFHVKAVENGFILIRLCNYILVFFFLLVPSHCSTFCFSSNICIKYFLFVVLPGQTNSY